MFRHSIKQGTRMGALSPRAAWSASGFAACAIWKGVQAYDYQHLELENIRSCRAQRARQQQARTSRRGAHPQSQWDENLSYSDRQTAGERRSCDCQVAAADGSSAVHTGAWRRICGGLVPPSISAADIGRSGQRRRRNIFAVETSISRIAGRLFRNSSRANLSQRSPARFAGAVPGMSADEPVFAVDPNLFLDGRRQDHCPPGTESRSISDASTGKAADGIGEKNNAPGDIGSGNNRLWNTPLYGEQS